MKQSETTPHNATYSTTKTGTCRIFYPLSETTEYHNSCLRADDNPHPQRIIFPLIAHRDQSYHFPESYTRSHSPVQPSEKATAFLLESWEHRSTEQHGELSSLQNANYNIKYEYANNLTARLDVIFSY